MRFLDNVHDFIRNLSRTEIIRYSALYVSICLMAMIAIFARHIMTLNEFTAKTTQLNKSRGNVQQIFTKYQVIQQQKNKIQELLKKNKNFYIQKYFQDLLTQQHLSTQVTSRFTSEKLPNEYIQESLVITIHAITTQQLCELLLALEQQPLVYVTFVDITPQAKKINVSMTLATMRAEE
jgi:hypothetical protein